MRSIFIKTRIRRDPETETTNQSLRYRPAERIALSDGTNAFFDVLDRYWRAANYLSAGQIYLQDNPLLRVPLALAHVKPRLLGHWGTTPGLNFVYTHLNRIIGQHTLDMILITGPGHGGPGLVAHAYLEGSYTERYPATELPITNGAAIFVQKGGTTLCIL